MTLLEFSTSNNKLYDIILKHFCWIIVDEVFLENLQFYNTIQIYNLCKCTNLLPYFSIIFLNTRLNLCITSFIYLHGKPSNFFVTIFYDLQDLNLFLAEYPLLQTVPNILITQLRPGLFRLFLYTHVYVF